MTPDFQQKAAIEAPDRNVLVSAGPGSGKTYMLSERVKWLCQERKAKPQNIAVCAFTQAAASELKKRLWDSYFSANDSDLLHCGTIHGLAAKVISLAGPSFVGLKEGFGVLSEDAADALLKRVASEQGASEPVLKEARERLKKANARATLTLRTPVTTKPEGVLAARYLQELKLGNAVDYDRLLVLGTKAADCLAFRRDSPLQHLLVDEFQDVTTLEAHFLEALNPLTRYYVGDQNQAIYGWRGSDVAHMQKAEKTMATFHVDTNYRSPRGIVAAANAFLPPGSRARSTLYARPDDGPPFMRQIVSCHELVGQRIYREWDGRCGTVAVLVRTNRLVDWYANFLLDAYIPVTTKQQPSKNLAALAAYLRYAGNPDNDLLCEDWIRQSGQGVLLELILPKARAQGVPLNRLHSGSLDGGRTLREVLEDVNERFPDPACAQCNEAASTLEEDSTPAELADALAQDGLFKADPAKLAVLTMHTAKGLEWDHVFVVDELSPDDLCQLSAEERRLRYVACNRARKKLDLILVTERV